MNITHSEEVGREVRTTTFTLGEEAIVRRAGSHRRVRVLAVAKTRALVAYRVSNGALRVCWLSPGMFYTGPLSKIGPTLLMIPAPGFASAVREWRDTLNGRVVAWTAELDRFRDVNRALSSAHGSRGLAIERASRELTKAARELAAFNRACPE